MVSYATYVAAASRRPCAPNACAITGLLVEPRQYIVLCCHHKHRVHWMAERLRARLSISREIHSARQQPHTSGPQAGAWPYQAIRRSQPGPNGAAEKPNPATRVIDRIPSTTSTVLTGDQAHPVGVCRLLDLRLPLSASVAGYRRFLNSRWPMYTGGSSSRTVHKKSSCPLYLYACFNHPAS